MKNKTHRSSKNNLQSIGIEAVLAAERLLADDQELITTRRWQRRQGRLLKSTFGRASGKTWRRFSNVWERSLGALICESVGSADPGSLAWSAAVLQQIESKKDDPRGEKPLSLPQSVSLAASHSPVASVLAVSSAISDPRQLGNLADRLIELCQLDQQAQNEFRDWLEQIAPSWVQSRHIAFAAVLEAACRIGLSVVAPHIVWALEEDDVPHLVSTIAAQRCRLLLGIDADARSRIQRALMARIDKWQHADIRAAVAALPSVPYMGTAESVLQWLLNKIANSESDVAWSALMALLDWACGTIPGSTVLENAARDGALRIVQARYEREKGLAKPDGKVIAGSVWLMGALATTETLSDVASIIVSAFTQPIEDEDAASLRAGRLLIVREKEHGSAAITKAFGDSQDQLQDFLAALVA